VRSEFPRSAALGPAGDDGAAWLARFPASDAFHAAIANDESLPLAFASYAETSAARSKSALFRAVTALEVAMTRARRADAPRVASPDGTIVLAPTASIVRLPAGTHALAARWDGETESRPAAARIDRARFEHVLLVLDATPFRFGRLPALHVEPLANDVAVFLAAVRTPLDAAGIARFAADHELAIADVEAVIDAFVADGVLVRGG
jgi:hypothetical protein